MNRIREIIERDQWAELLTDAKRITDQAKNSDIDVLAFTQKEAVKKASEIYGLASHYFVCEEVTKGSVGLMGWFRIPSRFLVKLKPEAKEILTLQTDYNKNNEIAKNKNGSFRLVMRKQGLELIIHAPTGWGTPVSFTQIEKDIEEKGIINYSKDQVHKALNNPGIRLIIAPYVRSSNDSTFTVHADNSNMSAYFSFTKPKRSSGNSSDLTTNQNEPLGRIPEPEEVISALKKIGVVHGINENIIRESLDNELYDIPVMVAEGTLMENGKNGYIEYTFPTGNDQFKHAILADGSVNFRELNIIHNVQKGDVLAIMHPPTRGIPGKNLLGDITQSTPGKEVSWNIGDNVSLTHNFMQAIATETGQVSLKNGQICVDTALVIKGDLDLTVGNIDFIGNIIIKGNVDDGFTIVSGGDIEIFGHIGKSFIHAKGNVIAHKGIQGRDSAKIECGKNLYAKFIERTHLTVSQNIIVTDYILHSTINCSENLIVSGGKHSVIAGGNVRVQGNIYAIQVGAKSYVETHIEVGYPGVLFRELSAMEIFITEKHKQIEILTSQISGLDGKIPEARLAKLKQKIFTMKAQRDNIVTRIEKLNSTILTIQNNAFLSVKKRLMPGVKLCIGNSVLTNTAEQSGGSFFKKDKLIVSGPYQPPQVFEKPSLTNNEKQ